MGIGAGNSDSAFVVSRCELAVISVDTCDEIPYDELLLSAH